MTLIVTNPTKPNFETLQISLTGLAIITIIQTDNHYDHLHIGGDLQQSSQ